MVRPAPCSDPACAPEEAELKGHVSETYNKWIVSALRNGFKLKELQQQNSSDSPQTETAGTNID